MVVPQKMKCTTSIELSSSTSGTYLKELKAGTQTDICLLMFMAVVIVKSLKVEATPCPLIKYGILNTGISFYLQKERKSDVYHTKIKPKTQY